MADPVNTSATLSPNLGWKLHFDPKDANEETLAALDSFIRGTGHEFKRVGLPGGGEASGKYYTVYPQSLEARDKFISSLEELNSKTNLLREIGPDFQLEGNTKLTPRISGRFTTGYSSFDPKTGLPLFGKSQTSPNEAIASDTMRRAGKINHYIKDSWTAPPSTHTEMTRGYGLRVTAEELAEDTRLLQEKYPSVYELLAGKPGYKSPYAQTSAPNIEDLRKLGSSGTVEASPTPNPSAEALIRTMRGEIADRDRLAEESLPATRKAVEENGFLYHYAPKSRRDSIAKHGIVSNQSDTAAQGPGKSFFFVNPEGHTLSQFAPDVASAGPDAGLDLYRVKATPEIIDQLKVDSHLPLRDGIGQSVYLDGDTAKGGFSAELISDKVDISTGEIIPKIKDTEPKVSAAVKTGDKKPVIKVGEVVESKGEKVKKDIPPRVKGKDVEKMVNGDSASKPKTIKDEIIDAAISSGTKKTEKDEEGKDIDEKVADKIKEKAEEKLDPVSKIENLIEKKKDEAIEELKDSVFKADDEAFARELAEKEGKGAATKSSIGSSDLDDSIKPTKATPAPVSPTPKGMDAAVDPGTKGTAASRRIVDAGGRTAADTPAARAVLAADSAADGSIFSMTPKAAVKTVGEDIVAMSRSVARGFKDSKNLRLAATAALLSTAGFGVGKVRNRMGAKQNQEVSPDESEMLRRSLLEDG